jgi:hypothetical protein
MNYHWYKFFHYLFLIIFISGLTASYFQKDKMKIIKIIYSGAAILTLITGIMLSIRVGANNYVTWPLWIKLKILLWSILVILFPILNKLTSMGRWLYLIQVPVIFLLIYAAIFKPM